MISFTQNLISLEKDHANICWIVENHSGEVISDAVAYSNLFCHDFGQIGVESIKTVSFALPLSKTSLLDGAFMNYLQNGESKILKSNILRNLQ